MSESVAFPNDEASILARALRPDNWRLTPSAAHAIQQIQLTLDDKVHSRELAARARIGDITAEEELEIGEYEKACRLIETLRAAARKCLQEDLARQAKRPARSPDPIPFETREDWDYWVTKAYGAEWVKAHQKLLDEQWKIVERF